jgi:NAD+ kinase
VADRHMLVLAHAARSDALAGAVEVCERLRAAGATPVVAPQGHPLRVDGVGDALTLGDGAPLSGIELTIVLGGDGTILGAAELMRESTAPLRPQRGPRPIRSLPVGQSCGREWKRC